MSLLLLRVPRALCPHCRRARGRGPRASLGLGPTVLPSTTGLQKALNVIFQAQAKQRLIYKSHTRSTPHTGLKDADQRCSQVASRC